MRQYTIKKANPMFNVREQTLSEGTLLVKLREKDPVLDEMDGTDTLHPREVAEYCTTLLADIRDMAGQSGLTFLAYLVQVALEEAKIQAGKSADK